MELKTQRRIAAEVLKCSQKRVYFSPEHLSEIKEAITKQDIRELINANIIQKLPKRGVSRFHARKILVQKRKGRRRGQGSRKGTKLARLPKKEAWMSKIRCQRAFLKKLKHKGLLSTQAYTSLYRKAKGGFFRSLNHLKYYIKERNLIQNAKKD
ncbi:50S ribosomal protein L19e [Candidatus Woesearchaeota archaeon]|nr:50S ribosomal protein L19e [Candidatus Woesearchaeota archaeon]RLE43615.1 MAG: 50S ribosomal protein L19e [Candidatus Woesearchaeota archaeon]